MTPKLDPVDDDEDGNGPVLLTLEEFEAACRAGAFVDDDGFGEFATTEGSSLEHRVYPSRFLTGPRPAWATHVAWFNK